MATLFQERISTRAGKIGQGLIEDVKLIGNQSANGRKYEQAALRAAIPMYEGCKVFVNHSKGPRNADERFGAFQNVREAADGGLIGNLAFMESHPMAARVKECAQRDLDWLGMSHAVFGDSKKGADGKEIVTAISEVRSVDLVTGAASTKGFFEQTEQEEEANPDAAQDKELLDSIIACVADKGADYDTAQKIFDLVVKHLANQAKSEQTEPKPQPQPKPSVEQLLEQIQANVAKLEKQIGGNPLSKINHQPFTEQSELPEGSRKFPKTREELKAFFEQTA
jgi:hypothetical protein